MRFFELFIALAFAAAWGILELVAKRYDRKPTQAPSPEPHSVNHSEGADESEA